MDSSQPTKPEEPGIIGKKEYFSQAFIYKSIFGINSRGTGDNPAQQSTASATRRYEDSLTHDLISLGCNLALGWRGFLAYSSYKNSDTAKMYDIVGTVICFPMFICGILQTGMVIHRLLF